MRIFWVMLKKELLENVKKSRFIVMLIVLLLFGIMSPLTARYLPEIITFILGTSDDSIGIPIELPAPSIVDSYAQYYKNLTQMGIFVQILIFMGIVSDEKSKGSAVLVLTKAVSRNIFLVSKFVAASLVVIATLIPSYMVFYLYTYLLFDKFPAGSSFIGVLMYLLFSIFIIAFTLFASTMTNKTSYSALIAIGGYFLLSILSVLPKISDWFPMKLNDAAYQISAGLNVFGDYTKSVVTTAVGIVALVMVSAFVFRKQEL
jgi:ABC-2 type transport system permease protein